VKIYPLDKPYTEQAILAWIDETKKTLMSQGFSKHHIQVEYWYLANYYEKTLVYESAIFEKNYLVRLELIWKLIEQLKFIKNKHNQSTLDSFITNHLKILITNTSAYYQNINNFDEQIEILKKCITLSIEIANKPIQIESNEDIVTVTETKAISDKPKNKNNKSVDKPDKKVFKLNPHAQKTVELDF
jgi:hypothetical protein